jgi:hypothetical protein
MRKSAGRARTHAKHDLMKEERKKKEGENGEGTGIKSSFVYLFLVLIEIPT